ncbi:MAG: hypothetical protein H7Y09_14210 [Chitinophagaceae bacterium]|nr:hypothetical protein [Anaerolineae bacterium]
MELNEIHNILFNAHILYSLVMSVWAAVMASRNESISGNFWGAVATGAVLAAAITVIGVIMALQGLQPGPEDNKRLGLYFIYMSWLVIIMPGLFTLLRGRDDRSAAIAFAILAFFNASVSFSMMQRMVISPWS